MSTETTTLVCLFHHDDQAQGALEDLHRSGIPPASISVMGNTAVSRGNENAQDTLMRVGVPARDLKHLIDGLEAGGTIVSVAAITDHVSTVERIFEHRAAKIDEAVSEDNYDGAPLAMAAAAAPGDAVIPIVEEALQVGKRTVDQGGVRVYHRIVEIPVDESIQLREERVIIERNVVDRPASQADLQGHRSIELIETSEEAVVGKTAHVVEEVLVGKQTDQRVEHIHDIVRRTEVEIEELPASFSKTGNQTF